MSCCEEVIEPTFLGWSSIAYVLLPLNIAFYDLGQLYLFNCNLLKYHTPFLNSFQTGVYTYVLSVLLLMHTATLFSCNGCSDCLQSISIYTEYVCYIPNISLHSIYAMLAMFSWTRFICRFRLRRYYNLLLSNATPTKSHVIALRKAKLSHKMLFKTKYHWTFTVITLVIVLSLDIFAYIRFKSWISVIIYAASCVSLLICETFIRDLFTMKHPQRVHILHLLEIKPQNKKAIVAFMFAIIAGCGYGISRWNTIALMDSNIDIMFMHTARGMYQIFNSLAITMWYWSLVGEDWIFKTPSEIVQQSTLFKRIQANIRESNSSEDTFTNDHDTVTKQISYQHMEMTPLQSIEEA